MESAGKLQFPSGDVCRVPEARRAARPEGLDVIIGVANRVRR
jgi:hypothetical protein